MFVFRHNCQVARQVLFFEITAANMSGESSVTCSSKGAIVNGNYKSTSSLLHKQYILVCKFAYRRWSQIINQLDNSSKYVRSWFPNWSQRTTQGSCRPHSSVLHMRV